MVPTSAAMLLGLVLGLASGFTGLQHTQSRHGGVRRRGVLAEVLRPEERIKFNTAPDSIHYDFPRLVQHADGRFLGQLEELYREYLKPGVKLWISHVDCNDSLTILLRNDDQAIACWTS